MFLLEKTKIDGADYCFFFWSDLCAVSPAVSIFRRRIVRKTVIGIPAYQNHEKKNLFYLIRRDESVCVIFYFLRKNVNARSQSSAVFRKCIS